MDFYDCSFMRGEIILTTLYLRRSKRQRKEKSFKLDVMVYLMEDNKNF